MEWCLEELEDNGAKADYARHLENRRQGTRPKPDQVVFIENPDIEELIAPRNW